VVYELQETHEKVDQERAVARQVQCLATCCSVLQCVAVCCSLLVDQERAVSRQVQYVATCFSVLQYVAVCCSVAYLWIRREWLPGRCSVLQCVCCIEL